MNFQAVSFGKLITSLIIGSISFCLLATTGTAFEYVETIEVSASRPDDSNLLSDLPAFITTIEISDDCSRFQTLPELLSGAVGVTIKDFGGLGKLSTVSIRGSSANQVIVLLDGVKINTASGSGVDLSTLPLDSVEKVEILRGADSAVYGSGAMGGVVNLITRKTDVPGWQSHGNLTYGSFNTSNVDLGLWYNRDGTSYRIMTKYQHSDGDYEFLNNNGTEFNPDDDYMDTRENNDIDAYGVAFWFKKRLLTDAEVTGFIEGFSDEKGIPGLITFPSVYANQEDQRISGTLRVEKSWPGETGFRVFCETSGKYSSMDFDDPIGEQTGVPIHTSQRTRVLGGRAGWDIYYSRGSGGLTLHFDNEQLDDLDFPEPERNTAAVSLRHDFSMMNDGFWFTSLLRYDDISDAGDHWSPKLGARWFISDCMSLRANAAFGFRTPSFNEIYIKAGFVSGNPDLLPEEARSYDFGLSYDAEKWRLEAALFRIDYIDLIQYLLVSGFRYKPYNIGKARSEGLEFDGSISFGPGFTFSGSYTWDKVTDKSGEPNADGNQIPGRPEHDVFSKIAWHWDSVNTWLEWHYLSGNFVTQANTKKLDNRSTGNIGVTWKINDLLQFGAEIKNLNDDDVVDVRGFPLPPRSYFMTIKISK
ncbi:TonB-dependent receptor [bacterium]|nr:TonB-dependent receptor [bacterium]